MMHTTTGFGVLYLTPDAPTSGGTGFFRSKIDGSLTSKDHDSPELEGTYGDYSKWDLVDPMLGMCIIGLYYFVLTSIHLLIILAHQ